MNVLVDALHLYAILDLIGEGGQLITTTDNAIFIDFQVLGHVEGNTTRRFENERHQDKGYEVGIQSKFLAHHTLY